MIEGDEAGEDSTRLESKKAESHESPERRLKNVISVDGDSLENSIE